MRLFAPSRRVIGLVLALLTALTGLVAIDSSPSQAATDKKVIVHVSKGDSNFTGLNLWMWYTGTDGKAYEFEKNGVSYATDAYGAYGTWDLPGSAAAQQVGFILRDNSWNKYPDGDRFINTFKDVNGVPTAEIWLKYNNKFVWSKQPSSQPSLLAAQVTGLNELKLTFDNSFDMNVEKVNFSVKSAAGVDVEVANWGAVTGNESAGYKVTVTLVEQVRIGTAYTISHPVYGLQESDLGSLWDLQSFNDQYYYSGDDLGNTYTSAYTDFRVWAPTADSIDLVTYASATTLAEDGVVHPMAQDVKGTWIKRLEGDKDGTIYVYRAHFAAKVNETIDPYARAVTINGERGVVVNLDSTDPVGWSASTRPDNMSTGNPTDAVLYELHVRDLSMDTTSNIPAAHKGKYLAFTDLGTRFTKGTKSTLTGLAAIKDLGVTHVELQPIYDFGSVDETGAGNQFNWGYDPKNYNVPEGSYSTDAANPKTRITELKQAIMSMHSNGLRVNMDVVYNHVQDSSNFAFEKLVPGYWYRRDATGTKTSGSGCGNDTATEHPMVSKFIQDSVKYWATEYNMDGFRFDLMGLIDISTMNKVRTQLNNIDPTIIMLGEGWNMGTLPEQTRATQLNSAKIPGIGTFNAIVRDGMKGGVWDEAGVGWVSGRYGDFASVQSGVVANAPFPGLAGAWIGGIEPGQTINYIESHDNSTFADRLRSSMGKTVPMATIAKVSKLGTGMLFVSQGVPFIQAGQEFLRSKDFNKNSYNSTDAVNSLKWNNRITYASNVSYLKGLLAIRKAHKAFRIPEAQSILDNLEFLDGTFGQIGYKINGKAVGDKWSTIVVLANSNPKKTASFYLPKGTYKVVADADKAGVKTLKTIVVKGKSTGKVTIPGLSMMVLYK
ncbi:MAG: type I pullulanase [Actinomycetes bacterium]